MVWHTLNIFRCLHTTKIKRSTMTYKISKSEKYNMPDGEDKPVKPPKPPTPPGGGKE